MLPGGGLVPTGGAGEWLASMKILANGKRLDGSLLIPPIDADEFGRRIAEQLGANAASLASLTVGTGRSTTFRGEIERASSVDLNDPRAAGWTFLVNASAPDRAALVEAIRPLAEHRGMADPGTPLLFGGEPMEDWTDWLGSNYFAIDALTPPPRYILILGGPEQVPFHFQALLDSAASVGRLAFDEAADLRAYAEKVVRLEQAAEPTAAREAVFFATDAGADDPTYYSRRYMAEPLADHVVQTFGLGVTRLMGEQASKANIARALADGRPALVYTASHGLGLPDQPLDTQKRLNGAICCQSDGPLGLDDLFGAEDVPSAGAFLEGAAVFQFACFGYGTPAQSDFHHWQGDPRANSTEDFVASLPKRLLAHPRGPIVYIGHVDTAWLHGFADPGAPDIIDPWSPRIAPFVQAVDNLLRVNPAAEGMAFMNKRFDLGNAQLATTWDRIQRGSLELTPAYRRRLADAFILRSDAQNYMLLGDPAAALRLPSP